MAEAINSFWKKTIAYFFGRGFAGLQKATFLKWCFDILSDFVKIACVTLGGIASNINMAQILGAYLSTAPFRPYFWYREQKYYLISDACHLLKLIRNNFSEYKMFYHRDEVIKYEFVENLCQFQCYAGLHLADSKTTNHVIFLITK